MEIVETLNLIVVFPKVSVATRRPGTTQTETEGQRGLSSTVCRHNYVRFFRWREDEFVFCPDATARAGADQAAGSPLNSAGSNWPQEKAQNGLTS